MYVWVMEILSGREKTIFGALPHLNFAFWGLAVAAIAYLIPNWHHMELVFSVPLIGLYVTYWVLPESPRWLLSQGRTEEAEEIVKKIAEYNGKPLDKSFKLVPLDNSAGSGNGRGILGFLQLFKTPYLRMKVTFQILEKKCDKMRFFFSDFDYLFFVVFYLFDLLWFDPKF